MMIQILRSNVDPMGALALNFMADMPEADIPNLIFTPDYSRPNHYPIRLLAIGIPEGVDSVVNELHARRFAEVQAWSRAMRARHPQEIMRIMTRDFVMNS